MHHTQMQILVLIAHSVPTEAPERTPGDNSGYGKESASTSSTSSSSSSSTSSAYSSLMHHHIFNRLFIQHLTHGIPTTPQATIESSHRASPLSPKDRPHRQHPHRNQRLHNPAKPCSLQDRTPMQPTKAQTRRQAKTQTRRQAKAPTQRPG